LESEPKNGSPETAKSEAIVIEKNFFFSIYTCSYFSDLKPSHALFSHGLCRWTGCEAAFDSFESFATHLVSSS